MIALGGSNSTDTYYTNATLLAALQGSPSNFLLAGYYHNNSFNLGGSYGYYWSATAYSDNETNYYNHARDLLIVPPIVSSADYIDRSAGISIRCVAKPTYAVTVNLDSNTASVTFTSMGYPTQFIDTNGGTVTLRQGVPYTITATPATGYNFSSWSTTANGTLGSTTTNPTTYTVTGTATLSVTSQ